MNPTLHNIAITGEYGLVVRRRALDERKLKLGDVLLSLEVDKPLDMDENLISLGPSFGSNALAEFSRRLIEMGLQYFDDFFEVAITCPSWVRLRAEYSAQPKDGVTVTS